MQQMLIVFSFVSGTWLCLIFGICSRITPYSPPLVGGQKVLKPVYEWSQIEFDYTSEEERRSDILSETFVPGAAVPIDVDVYYARKSFYVIYHIAMIRDKF